MVAEIVQMESNRRLRERLLYLASLVTDPHLCHEENGYWRRLYSQILDDVCGFRLRKPCYRDLLARLEAAGLIEIDASYKAGGDDSFCKAYRCPRPWQTEPRVIVMLDTVTFPNEQSPADAASDDDPAVAYLADCYLQSDLDVPHALRLLAAEHGLPVDLAAGDLDDAHFARYSNALAANERYTATPGMTDEQREEAEHKRGSSVWALDAVWQGWVTRRPWFKRDRTASRLHSPVTSLPSYLRPALRLAGSDRLVSLDLKCSQIVFAAAWMLEDSLDASERGRLWLEIASNGDPYITTWRICHPEQDRDPTPAERDKWKRDLFKLWWYATQNTQEGSAFGRLLAAAFPEVHDWIHKRKKGGYRKFPIELQRREAKVFIDDLALRLRDAGVPVLTIHDSIIVLEADAQLAETLMREALSVLQVRPQIKAERYSRTAH